MTCSFKAICRTRFCDWRTKATICFLLQGA